MEGGGRCSESYPADVTLHSYFLRRKVFIKRYYDYDLRDYNRGYYFSFFGIVRVLKFKVNTVMEKEDWIVIIEIFGREFVLFSGKHIDSFRWVVAIFAGDGATRVMIRAHKCDLLTYYPTRFNNQGNPVPLFRNYLFVEFREYITLDICRSTSNFIKVLSARDDEGLARPVLVPRNAIDENRAMVMAGRFNERSLQRQFYGRGSLVRVLEGTFIDRRVRLEEDVFPDWRGNHKVKVDIDGLKGVIEVHKLAL
jgi:hypothetical protein